MGADFHRRAVPDDLLASHPCLEPLEVLRREHDRQLAICSDLESIADNSPDAYDIGLAGRILDYLIVDLPRHMADEEEDLIPLLRRRCRPHDDLDAVLDQIFAEHATDTRLADGVKGTLEIIALGRVPDRPLAFAQLAGVFAEFQRRHLMWENAVLLPLAWRRLNEVDLVRIGHGFARRRGEALL